MHLKILETSHFSILSLSLFSEEVILAEDDNGPGDSMNVPVLCMLNKVTEFKHAIMSKMQ